MVTAEPESTHKTSFQYIKICIFIACLTIALIYLYSSPNSRKRIAPYRNVEQPHHQKVSRTSKLPKRENVPSFKKGYLVYSQSCKIPDVSPWHPSIRRLIAKTAPLDCSDYETLTVTKGNKLKLISLILNHKDIFNITCCYKSVFRNSDGSSDNSVGYGSKCTVFDTEVEISDEFIEVICSLPNGTAFYKNFHSFIHRKSKVEERCSRTPRVPDRYSLLVLGIDAMSRLNMHRQLNATAQFLLEKLGAVEMFGFNKVGDNTFPNLIPLLLGYDERELADVCWNSSDLPLDKCDFLWKQFARQGYRTFYAEDAPHISSFNYLKSGFHFQPTDYYFRHFILAYEEALGRNKPLNCHLCIGSISETEAILQWLQKFMIEFSNDPYFAFAWVNSLTHDFLNLGSAGDHMYKDFFEFLYTEKKLENTIVVVMGDHGMRWGEIRKTFVGRLEERLPILLIALPPKFKSNHPEATNALKLNSHRLVTPFDLHATLKNLLNVNEPWSGLNTSDVPQNLVTNYSRRAFSVFQPMPENRSCVDAFIDEHWCTCEMQKKIDRRKPEVKSVANFIVDTLNLILKPLSEVCSGLHLHNILESRIWGSSIQDKPSQTDFNVYTVVVQTMPGGGIFEGTVKHDRSTDAHEAMGTVSRLNLYGNQSSCVHDVELIKYCFCLQNSKEGTKLKAQTFPTGDNIRSSLYTTKLSSGNT